MPHDIDHLVAARPGNESSIVIVGAGQAGLSTAEKLRANGFVGSITLVGEEPDAPYQRPPLSKAYLLGELERARLKLKAEDWYARNRIALRLGTRVASIDRARRRVCLADGAILAYDCLVLATGAIARKLPQAISRGLAGIFTIRTLADIDALRPALEKRGKLLVIGGGYIGLEIAAVARGLGMTVDVVEAAERPLARVASAETAASVEALHRSRGVTFHVGKAVSELLGADRVAGARLGDGTIIAADVVVAGIGGMPETALAAGAGLAIDNGIAVDAYGRSDDPFIWAAGDCANFSLSGGGLRMESVGNAIDSADLVARNIMGARQPYRPKPWFWSDQFDLKLQIAGLSRPGDTVVVRQGAGPGRSHWYYREGRLVAVDGLNAPRDYLVGKRFLAASASPDPVLVADPMQALEAPANN
ncbi:NAD(P)/FAD-dependent oxidoreductase [Mesorhizobium amorphae]|uniref:FAD-dependent pyridine nucleotide-disulfide oxidoreductase n=1 Tax=Mesorhizobium amorphae CCNWGS0123 TaxID=1082933 RepID=G6Y8L9_9HYPH|nr:FAD-dependent oxidoreductase [Mesorhizobium amorphae]ANT52918.1 pyridine nucleotide-disulfide oxidoreductase [Mesorhizobium amorphae CCNWGS0123]EHH11921.1 FAD-dependent pyridine nucleotide-disulfide oxidoreductase [Mesorhizobium amorphae CCNWGS0123]GLR40769.1 pyridine nucleotide-disulfide oxidoreductase [Mesorhizobium amorphae]